MASITLGHILVYINFHIRPLEILLQILIHLTTSGVNGEFGHMSLIKDRLSNFWVNRNHKTFSKPYHIIWILLETGIFGVSLC
jgi:hypothetical protein